MLRPSLCGYSNPCILAKRTTTIANTAAATAAALPPQ